MSQFWELKWIYNFVNNHLRKSKMDQATKKIFVQIILEKESKLYLYLNGYVPCVLQ